MSLKDQIDLRCDLDPEELGKRIVAELAPLVEEAVSTVGARARTAIDAAHQSGRGQGRREAGQ